MSENNPLQPPVDYKKEWHCFSCFTRKFFYFLPCLCLFGVAGAWWYYLPEIKMLAWLIAFMAFIGFIFAVSFITKYATVSFNPHYIGVNHKKIDITQLQLIKFYKYKIRTTRYGTTIIGPEFIMTFKAESGIKETILFVMTFNNPSSYEESFGIYNYTDRFIKILWQWVKEANQEKITECK